MVWNMASNLDVYRVATNILTEHGYDAPTYVAQRAVKKLHENEFDNCRAWIQILKAIRDLMIVQAPPDAKLH